MHSLFLFKKLPMSSKYTIALWFSIIVITLSFLSIVVLGRNMDEIVSEETSTFNTSVRVAVFNGCGRSGLAASCADYLRDCGFDVVNGLGANADSFDFMHSAVLVRKGDSSHAESVAGALGSLLVLEQRSSDPYIIEDVAVILGRDWNTLRFAREVDTE